MASQLRSLAETDVRTHIPPETLLPALQQPPFIYVPGTFNLRDIGLLTDALPKIRPGFIYRSGGLAQLSGEGQAALRDQLGVRRIFDLRSQAEHAASPDPEIEGIEVVWLGSGGTTEQDAKVDLAPFAEGEGEKGYVAMYFEILDGYKGVFREVLRSVRDKPEESILFHCTAGRDRTGVLAGMLESLAGYDPKVVQTDFLLTRIGYEPAREQLVKFAMKWSGADTGDEPDLELSYNIPAFYNLVSLKASCWDAFVDAVKKDYGGFEGYVTKVLGFSDDHLVKIKDHLVGKGRIE
ncbi:hypothetical protein N0V93_000176 [Gnomoniopsis smithogilvyi]|uniref:Tyrosine specific protein phosphatases domain-containing protein n=1 Tax=Gnomoniopsis smithogilvyi TaxID=1191159 RepID=A0A9W9D1G1_9PEZI|nr:hypothetical protein N0V93_000176 [Gnomoniopsis smithogilvyi]